MIKWFVVSTCSTYNFQGYIDGISCIIIAVNILYQVDGNNCHTNDDKLHSKNVSECDIYQETSNNDKLIKEHLEIEALQENIVKGNIISNQLKTKQFENNTKLNIRVSERGLDYDSNIKSEHNKVAFDNIKDSRDQLYDSINDALLKSTNSSDTVLVFEEKLDEITLNRTEDNLQDQLVNEQTFIKFDKSGKLPLTEKGNETKTNNNVVLNIETNFLNKGFSVDGNHEKVPIKVNSSSNFLDLVTTRKVYDPEYFKLVFDKKYLDLDVSDEPYIVSKIPVDHKKVFNENEVQNDLIMNINNNHNEFNKILVNNTDHFLRDDIGYYLVPLDKKEKIIEEKESKEIDTDISFRIIPGFPKFNTNIYHLNYRRMNVPVNITEDSSNDITENKRGTTIEEKYSEKYKTGHESAIKDLDEADIRINKLVNNLGRKGYKYYDKVIPGIPKRKMMDEIPNTRIISRQHVKAINIQDLRQELLNHLLDYIINIIRKDKADDNSEARLVEKLRDENSRYLEVVVLSDIFENIPHMSESSTYYSKLKTSNNTAPLNIDISNTKNVTYPNNVHNFAHGYGTNYEVNNIYSITKNYKNSSTINDIISNDMQPTNFNKITNYAKVNSDLYDYREQYGSKKLNEENSVQIKNTENIKNSEELLNLHDDLNTNYSDIPAESNNEKQDNIGNLNNMHNFELSANYLKTGDTTKRNNSSISPDKTINIDNYLLDDKNSQHQYFIVPDLDNITDSSRLTESVNKEQNPNLLNNSAKEVVDVNYIINNYSEHQNQTIKEKEINNIIELLNSLTSTTILHDTNVFSSDHETVVSNYVIHDDNRNQTEILKENSNNIVLSKPITDTKIFNSHDLLNTNYYQNMKADNIIKISPLDKMQNASDEELRRIITLNLDHDDQSIGDVFDNFNTVDSDYNNILHDGTLSEFPDSIKVTDQQVNGGTALNSIAPIDNVSNTALHDNINNHITHDTIKNDTINFTLEPSITIKKEIDFLTADNHESLGKRIKSILFNVNVTYY